MKSLFLCLLLLFSLSFALTPEEEKQLLKDVAEIKATLKVFMEQTDKRFEQVDKRFEEVNHKIEMILVFMGILAGTFATMTAVNMGFAIWDRFEAFGKLAKKDEELAKFLKERNLL